MQGPGAGGEGRGLRIPKMLYDELVAHCKATYPKEACGYLMANAAGCVERVYPMTNVEDSPIGYAMDPKEQLRAEKETRQRDQRIIGVYHSHTATGAFPSPVDVGLAVSADISYAILSLQHYDTPQFNSYRIDGTTITEEPVIDPGP